MPPPFKVIIPDDLGPEFEPFPAADPNKVRLREATEALTGVLRVATQTEVNAGTSNRLYVVPATLKFVSDGINSALANEVVNRIAAVDNEANLRATADANEVVNRDAAILAAATDHLNNFHTGLAEIMTNGNGTIQLGYIKQTYPN